MYKYMYGDVDKQILCVCVYMYMYIVYGICTIIVYSVFEMSALFITAL